MNSQVTIDYGLDLFAKTILDAFGPEASSGRIIRDVFGRLSFVAPDSIPRQKVEEVNSSLRKDLRPFLLPGQTVSSAAGFRAAFLDEPGLMVQTTQLAHPLWLLDRRVAGEAWLASPPLDTPSTPRLAFYGLKGGVGRTTALAICAGHLASQGKNVLIIDLDLEAPGIDSLLLSTDRRPSYGVLDWLASTTLGLDASSLLVDMIGGSPFTSGAGVVDVVPVAGAETLSRPASYLAKLARAYTPGAPVGPYMGEPFTEKVNRLINELTELRPYDIVMIDVRAGLHETSASALLGLGATCLLFGTGAQHTFVGYSILLASIRQTMESWINAPDLRSQFRMVHGRATQDPSDRETFKSSCWQLWLDHLYDAAGDGFDVNEFSYDLDDIAGPHFPLIVPSNENFVVLDLARGMRAFDENVYLPVFGGLISFASRMIKKEGEL
jgi:hypothetical protein